MPISSPARFGLDNRGTKPCIHCGVLSWARRVDEGTGLLCPGCFEAASYENQHNDTDGEHYGNVEKLCPTCFPELEQKRLAKAAARVASYGAVAAQRAERAAQKELSYPYCPHCGQRRPKTKAWEKTGVAALCSDCKSDADWIAFYTTEVRNPQQAALYQRSLDARKDKYVR